MSDNIYDIIGKLNGLGSKDLPVSTSADPVYESVDPNDITASVNSLMGKYEDFLVEEKAKKSQSQKDADVTRGDPELIKLYQKARLERPTAASDDEALAYQVVKANKELEKATAANDEQEKKIADLDAKVTALSTAKPAAVPTTPAPAPVATAQPTAAPAAPAARPTAPVLRMPIPTTAEVPAQVPAEVPVQTTAQTKKDAEVKGDQGDQGLAIATTGTTTGDAANDDEINVSAFGPNVIQMPTKRLPTKSKTQKELPLKFGTESRIKVAEGYYKKQNIKNEEQTTLDLVNIPPSPVLTTKKDFVNYNNEKLEAMLRDPALTSVALIYPGTGKDYSTINLTRPMFDKLKSALASIKNPEMHRTVAIDVLSNRETASRYLTSARGDKELHFFYNVKPNETGKAFNLGLKANPQGRWYAVGQENPNATKTFGKPQTLWVSPPRGKLAGTQQESLGNDTMQENIKTNSILEGVRQVEIKKLKEEAKPDFLDLDKDGDTDEPMKKAAKDAKEHEPAKVDKDAVAKRKRLQALKDRQEDERAEKGDYDDEKSSSRKIKGRAYGGSAQKDDEEKDLDEGSMKHAMHADAEKMSLKKFCDKYGDDDWVKEFYNDINGPLDEQAQTGNENGQFVGYSDFMDAEIPSITTFLDKQGVKHSLDQGKDDHGLEYTNLVVFNIDDKLKKRIDDYLNKRTEKYNAENTGFDGYLGYEPESDQMEESGLQAYLGKKKYGKEGMKALQKAGREGASKEKMALIRAKHDKMEEAQMDEISYSAKAARAGKDIGKPGKAFVKIAKSAGERYGSKERGEKVAGAVLKKLRANEGEGCMDEVAPPGAKAERMVKHIKKGYSKDGKLTPKEKGIAYATAWKAHNKGQVEEGTEFGDTIKNSEAKMTKVKMTEGKEAIRNHPIYTNEEAWNHYKQELDEQEAMEAPVVDVQEELNEIARLAGLSPKMEAKGVCPSCKCEKCECNETLDPMVPGDSASPLTHTEEGMGCSMQELEEAMSRKHYREMADKIKHMENRDDAEKICRTFVDMAKADNPRFKEDMFLAACGIKSPAAVLVDEETMDEGNEFTKARLDAIAAGKDSFTVGGKEHKVTGDTSDEKTQVESIDDEKQAVKEDINVSITANGEQDALNLLRKLSGMAEVPQVTGVAIPVGEEAVEEEREIELANTPHEKIAPITAVTTDAGGGLGGVKKQYPLAANRGANPIEEAKEEQLWRAYESMINDLKA